MDRQLMARFAYTLLPIWCGFLISGTNGLKQGDVKLVVPQVILEGKTLVMDCRFPSNESSSVSSVKWYKGNREFFRYTPRESPQGHVIPFADIHVQVDKNQSDMNKIVVKEVPAAFRGNITCEVTIEPTYHAVYETSYLLVAVPPEREPILTIDIMKHLNNTAAGSANWHHGLRTKSEAADENAVNFGDTLVARCTAGPSTPPVDLSFLINDHLPKLYRGVSIAQELKSDPENRTSKIATMNVTLQHSHFSGRKFHVKCLANLYNLYNGSSNEVIKELPRESMLTASGYGVLGHSGGSRLQCAIGFGKMVLLLLPLPPTIALLLLSPLSSATAVFRR